MRHRDGHHADCSRINGSSDLTLRRASICRKAFREAYVRVLKTEPLSYVAFIVNCRSIAKQLGVCRIEPVLSLATGFDHQRAAHHRKIGTVDVQIANPTTPTAIQKRPLHKHPHEIPISSFDPKPVGDQVTWGDEQPEDGFVEPEPAHGGRTNPSAMRSQPRQAFHGGRANGEDQ